MSVDPDIEEQLAELRDLRRDAVALARSGNPAVRAEGKAAMRLIQQDIQYLLGLTNAQL